MFLNSYVHQKVALAHRRDLLETADRYRLAVRVTHSGDARRAFHWQRTRRKAALGPCLSGPTPCTATR